MSTNNLILRSTIDNNTSSSSSLCPSSSSFLTQSSIMKPTDQKFLLQQQQQQQQSLPGGSRLYGRSSNGSLLHLSKAFLGTVSGYSPSSSSIGGPRTQQSTTTMTTKAKMTVQEWVSKLDDILAECRQQQVPQGQHRRQQGSPVSLPGGEHVALRKRRHAVLLEELAAVPPPRAPPPPPPSRLVDGENVMVDDLGYELHEPTLSYKEQQQQRPPPPPPSSSASSSARKRRRRERRNSFVIRRDEQGNAFNVLSKSFQAVMRAELEREETQQGKEEQDEANQTKEGKE